jgi:hypothetical protein
MHTARFLIVTGLLAVCASDAAPPLEAREPLPEANIRFINRLSETASVAANGTVVFSKVTAGSVTGWTAVRDTVTTFTLTLGESDTTRATTSAELLNGSHYTVSAASVNGGVVLAVVRDNGPDDTVNIARPKAGVVTKP